MRIKLDENLPASLAEKLNRIGHDTETVRDEGLAGQDDEAIRRAAQREERFLITPDLDFSDAGRFSTRSGAGILVVRLQFPSRRRLETRILALFESENVAAWAGRLVVASDVKLRIR